MENNTMLRIMNRQFAKFLIWLSIVPGLALVNSSAEDENPLEKHVESRKIDDSKQLELKIISLKPHEKSGVVLRSEIFNTSKQDIKIHISHQSPAVNGIPGVNLDPKILLEKKVGKAWKRISEVRKLNPQEIHLRPGKSQIIESEMASEGLKKGDVIRLIIGGYKIAANDWTSWISSPAFSL